MHIPPGDRHISDELNKKIAELNSQKFTRLDRFAIWINQQIGSFRFFLLLLAWTILWLFWNTFGPVGLRFDPFPAFVLWLFILPLLMVGQELESCRSDLRAEIDFEINSRAEEENREILKRLEEQQKEIHQLLKK